MTIRNSGGTKSLCLVHVYSQTGLKGVKVIDMTEASPENFTIKAEVETMQAVVTKGEENSLVTPGTYTNAKYTGNTLVTATTTTTPPVPAQRGPVPSIGSTSARRGSRIRHRDRYLRSGFSFDVGKVTCADTKWEWEFNLPDKKIIFLAGGQKFDYFVLGKAAASVEVNQCSFRLYPEEFKATRFVGYFSITASLGRPK